jgi:hypothetical protein
MSTAAEPNTIIGNAGGVDFSALRAPSEGGATVLPTGDPVTVRGITGIQTDPNMPLSNEEAEKEKEKINSDKEKCKTLRLKLYGYYHKLPEMMGMVDWPSPIQTINQYSLEQLGELYDAVIDSRNVSSISGGGMLHNGLSQGLETMLISQGFMVNGFADAVSVESEAKNVKRRLKQLVTIIEIEHQLGIQNPLLEYAAIMGGTAMMLHRLNMKENRDLVVEFQAQEPVPGDVLNQFSDL